MELHDHWVYIGQDPRAKIHSLLHTRSIYVRRTV